MASLTVTVSGDAATFNIVIAPTDPTSSWEVLVYAQTDHGQGCMQGDYPCFVEKFMGVGSSTITRNYTTDSYYAEIDLLGIGLADVATFVIVSGAPAACTINAAYFTKNESPISGTTCTANQTDTIGNGVNAAFSGVAIGQKYNAVMQIKNPDGTTEIIASPYVTVTAATTFTFGNMPTPFPVGTYTITSASIYDIYGNQLCTGTPAGGFCQSLTVTATGLTLTTILVTPASATVGVNGTQPPLTATCKDQNGNSMTCPPLNWQSDNLSVAVVDPSSGIVTGVSAGTANITAYWGAIVSNKCAVTVSAAAAALTTISLSAASVTVGIGGSQQLTATCKDQNGNAMTCPQLLWSSDTPSVAAVFQLTGEVIGIDTGTANITATYLGIVSNACVVTVSAAASALTTITLSQATATVDIAGTQSLTATCKDQNGKAMTCLQSMAWMSDNPSVAMVDVFTGVVTGIAKGTANITAYYGSIVSNKCVVTVSGTVAPPPGTTSGIGTGTALGITFAALAALVIGYAATRE